MVTFVGLLPDKVMFPFSIMDHARAWYRESFSMREKRVDEMISGPLTIESICVEGSSKITVVLCIFPPPGGQQQIKVDT